MPRARGPIPPGGLRDDAEPIWAEVDRYFGDLLAPADAQLDAALAATHKAGLPPVEVSPLLGKFLQMMTQLTQARRILEIGTLGGYSTIWMARALPPDGRMITLEYSPKHAEVARGNLERAGLLDRVEIRVGRALDSLPMLKAAGAGSFDLIFIDADKSNNPAYLEWSLKLSRPGTVIVVDNVVRGGQVVEAGNTDPDILGVRRMTAMMAAEPRLSATALQNVGARGYDGFAVAVVLR